MKKLFIVVSCVLGFAQAALAQTDSIAAEVAQTAAEKPTDWGEVIFSILVLIVALGIIAHMVYELFFKKPHPDISVEEGKAARHVMTKYSQTKKTLALLDEIAAANPDREDVVNRYNEINAIYNGSMKRQYNGSTKYIVLCVIIAALMAWASGSGWYSIAIFFALQIAIYWLASMTPTYLLDKKALKGTSGKPKFMSGMIAGILGLTATAPTYVTITKWDDGTTTKDEDNSMFWIALIFTIILLVVLAFFMFVVALFNYLRNYVLHI